jgi:hypothetical protein
MDMIVHFFVIMVEKVMFKMDAPFPIPLSNPIVKSIAVALGLTSATSSSKPLTHVLPAVCLPGKHQLRTRTNSRKNVENKTTYIEGQK